MLQRRQGGRGSCLSATKQIGGAEDRAQARKETAEKRQRKRGAKWLGQLSYNRDNAVSPICQLLFVDGHTLDRGQSTEH
jgi:hypothetical protein